MEGLRDSRSVDTDHTFQLAIHLHRGPLHGAVVPRMACLPIIMGLSCSMSLPWNVSAHLVEDCWIWRHDSCRRSPSTQSSVRSPRSLSYHWYNKLRLHTARCSPLLQQLCTALSILCSPEQNDERDIISNVSWTKWLIQLMNRIPCWMIVHSFTQSNWSSWINFLVK